MYNKYRHLTNQTLHIVTDKYEHGTIKAEE